jgi:hypothetical protein
LLVELVVAAHFDPAQADAWLEIKYQDDAIGCRLGLDLHVDPASALEQLEDRGAHECAGQRLAEHDAADLGIGDLRALTRDANAHNGLTAQLFGDLCEDAAGHERKHADHKGPA